MQLGRLAGFDRQRFLAEYWRKQPCLITGWLDPSPLEFDRLLDLADACDLPTRLVRGSSENEDWSVDHGPIGKMDLPEESRDWTVLVQEVDKVDPAVAALLEDFRFLPNWIIDDIMISQAVPGGSVGPHLDAYDVFLVQAKGRRRWELADGSSFRADERFELALLESWVPEFTIETVPGDVLYLPAGVGHHGVALDEAQTWSVGLRTPSGPELLFELAETVLGRPDKAQRLSLERIDPAQSDGIPSELIAQARAQLEACLEMDDRQLGELLAAFLTRWRLWESDSEVEPEQIHGKLRAGLELPLALNARLALLGHGEDMALFVNGERIEAPARLARELSVRRRIGPEWLEAPDALEQLIGVDAIGPLPGPRIVSSRGD
ncbi:cupin domain-containing protein [Wenzhouxiangella marina]|uniref:Uncharacterized protein n=1 Tax=Wenzhouxiangella marina TaxID=1579979 RepID=A0A0K0XW97_9GAMM|nr:cupin domain-containing protein [Wenzhouxiangella marina]AKS41902.1 hypothetical protein WM2015_1532 [Wenzhouxiangella marina]MBB6086331.1 50S ribosomal protein L16 3-hydroxylase [Wenzhouxiangella marina]